MGRHQRTIRNPKSAIVIAPCSSFTQIPPLVINSRVAKNPKKAASYSAVYTVEEFAKIFKLSLQSVRALIRTGEIPAIRIGKQHRIPQAVVDHYFAQATLPTERGFGMWKKNRVPSLPYVNKLRDQDRRGAASFLKDITEDD